MCLEDAAAIFFNTQLDPFHFPFINCSHAMCI